MGQTLLTRLGLAGRLIRRCPHVAVVPFLAFCIMVALGVFGVMRAREVAEEQNRHIAQLDAENAKQALDSAIERATLPMAQMIQLVRRMPTKQEMLSIWPKVAPSWWLGTVEGTVSFALAPLGQYIREFWYTEADPIKIPESSVDNGGWIPDMFDPIMLQIAATQSIVEGRRLTMAGPVRSNTDTVQNFFVLQQPIFLPNVSKDETWGQSMGRGCMFPTCWDEATRSKFWGFASLGLDMRWLLSPEGPLGGLTRKGYSYQLWAPPYPPSPDPKAPKEPVSILKGQNITEPQSIVNLEFPVIDKLWELHVWKKEWTQAWMLPLIAVVVLGAFLVSALLFSTLLSRAEHQELLHSLLPEDTIKRMRNEGRWAKSDTNMIKTMHLETPAEHMLRIIEDNLTNQPAPLPLLLNVREALQRSADVYRPSNQLMKEKMQAQANMDDDVRRALAAQLMDTSPPSFESGASVTSLGSMTSLGSLINTKQAKALDRVRLSEDQFSAQHVTSANADNKVNPGAPFTADIDMYIPSKSVNDGAAAEHRKRNLINAQAAACSDLLTDTSCSGEACTVLANWLLQAPAVAQLVAQGAHQPEDAAREPAQLPAEDQLISAQVGDEQVVVTVMKPILTQLEKVLATADDWHFDVYALEEASFGRPLSALGFWVMQSSGLKAWSQMSSKKLVAFLDKVESGYLDNPYHNKRHAADVLQTVHVIMQRSGLLHGYVDQLTQLGCYLSAIIHDFEHVGCTNDFLVNSSDQLAVRYNDRSPMENHHLAAAWALLKTKDYDVLRGLPKAEVLKLRKLIIDLVLGTDMKQHFAILGQFETLSRPAPEHHSAQLGGGQRGGNSISSRDPSVADVNSILKPLNDQDRLLSLQMMLKCADLGHIAAPLPEHLKWVSALESEFFLQGDKEKELGIPISPLCDRSKEGVTKSQIGFFDFVVLPLYKTFSQRFRISPLFDGVLANLAYWKSVTAAQQNSAAK